MGFIIGLLLATTTFALADYPVRMTVNGREIYSDVPPQIINGRTMIPARALAEALGAKVDWDAATSTVIVTKPETTKIVEPKPLNVTGQINVTGSQNFKDSIEQALSLLKEKAAEDYRAVAQFVVKINENNSINSVAKSKPKEGVVEINWNKFNYITEKIDQNSRHIWLASVLRHESHHVYSFQKGLNALHFDFSNGFRATNGLSPMEDEILAFYHERKTLKRLNAAPNLLDAVDLNKVADTDYYGNLQ
ncbi:MAG: hypothetical protein K6U74_21025 [Firmicutes bacterium]|nr:hypothetical protein [Bacillota bacterium]